MQPLDIGRYRLDENRYYDPKTHLWLAPSSPTRASCGLDPLGAETCGDIVAVSLEPVGARVERGAPFGWVEAAKFVGPLLAPVACVIAGHNPAPLSEPALLNSAPLDTWLIELDSPSLAAELGELVTGRAALEEWFGAAVERFERQGMIAE